MEKKSAFIKECKDYTEEEMVEFRKKIKSEMLAMYKELYPQGNGSEPDWALIE